MGVVGVGRGKDRAHALDREEQNAKGRKRKLATTHEFAKNRVLGGRLRIIDFWR
jgi:hypothetical protein